jgi:spermidine synthase
MITRETDAPVSARREVGQIAAVVAVCFFFSGTTGLVYEILWTRMLGLVFGHTVFAITTVLAAFMAGLGLGSYLVGSLADRHDNPLRLYGLFEVGIGVYALLTPLLFSQAELLYIFLRQSLGLSYFTFSLCQFLLVFAVLLVPATLMGATLPVMSKFFARDIRSLGTQVGRLYALNTFGAVLGTYAAGFHLLPTLGVKTTLLMAAVANVGIGALALVFARHLQQLRIQPADFAPRILDPDRPAPDLGRQEGRWQDRAAVRLCIVGLGLSGAASMIYEVTWTRALSLTIGSSTYAFSTMLVTFLIGLALGSFLFSRIPGRLQGDPFLFGCLQLGIGLGALGVMPLFDRLPEVFLWVFRLSQSSGFVKALQFGISALTMLLPTLFMGATFPCVVQIASRGLRRVGRDVGRIYFINTSGAIAGTLLAGFLLIPVWGLQTSLRVAVSVNLCLALGVCLLAEKGRWRRRLAILAPLTALALLAVSPVWNVKAMASGVAIYGQSYLGWLGKADFREAVASTDQLLFYKDGISATVTVHRRGANTFLKVNGKTDASSIADMHTQLMLAHLPLVLHPEPRRVLVIGLGSGVTAGAVAVHPVQEIDVIEIEPAVVEGARFFARENRNVLRNPQVKVTIADGRNFLLAAERPYDLIISEPSNPWMRGIGSLFSVEFYELAARRLTQGGIVCQWIHGYGLFPDDLKMVVKTFRSIFPHTTVWNTMHGDFLLVGSQAPLALDYDRLQSRSDSIPGLREDLAKLGFRSPLAILADFMLGEEDAARYAQYAWLNTDDLPLLEFSAPDSLYVETADLNRRTIMGYRQREFPRLRGAPEEILRSPEFYRNLGLAFWKKDFREEALVQFDRALRLAPQDPTSLLYRSRLHLRSGTVLKAEADLKTALRTDPGFAEAHEALGQLYRGQGMEGPAEAHLQRAAALQPKNAQVLAQLADLYNQHGRFADAVAQYRAAVALSPQEAGLWSGLAHAYQGVGLPEEALTTFRQAISRDPENSLYYFHLGRILLTLKRVAEATEAIQASILRDPLRVQPLLELGKLYAMSGKREEALRAYLRVLRLEPQNLPATRAIDDLMASAERSGS